MATQADSVTAAGGRVISVKENQQNRFKQTMGLFIALLVCSLPVMGVIGIRYGANTYSMRHSITVEGCVVKSVVEAPGETLLVVELPGQEYSFWPQMCVVRAYGTRERDRQEVETGDMVTCAFPDQDTRQKGFVVWEETTHDGNEKN